ncbi:hypothetical protein [Rhodospirillaceae bacterium SYSU D60014]|uniref:hypothetical protein n=1 Tax=Virgifigura deserti TaxID=2268457 RepID=UPI000E674D99
MFKPMFPTDVDIWKLASFEETCSPRATQLGERWGAILKRVLRSYATATQEQPPLGSELDGVPSV